MPTTPPPYAAEACAGDADPGGRIPALRLAPDLCVASGEVPIKRAAKQCDALMCAILGDMTERPTWQIMMTMSPPGVAGDGEITRMQNGVRSFVSRGLGKGVRSIHDISPQMMLSLLCASALAPLITIDPGLSGAGVAAGATVLSSIGAGTLSGLLANAIDRARSKDTESTDLEPQVADAICDALNLDDDKAARLRVEIFAMLEKIDAGIVALQAAIDSGKGEIYSAIVANVSSGFSEMSFLIADVLRAADKIRARVDDQGIIGRRIMDQNSQAAVDIRLILERFDSMGRAGERTTAGTVSRLNMRAPTECPYRGLLPFVEADENVFYGRERACVDLAVKVSAQVTSGGLIVVTGASGAGKSSILRAGLLPILARGIQVAGCGGRERRARQAARPGSAAAGRRTRYHLGRP